MDAISFAPINTVLSVRERRMLQLPAFKQILEASDDEAVALILQATRYPLDEPHLQDPNAIEDLLIARLAKEYAFAFEQSPSPELVEIFALRYSYHNLKVLLKSRASHGDLTHLLLPFGAYPQEVLEHLVTTLDSEYCPAIMTEEVVATWAEYEDYHDIRVLEIGMDLAYFKHLRQLAKGIDNPDITRFVDTTIDFYNVTTVKRALHQGKPQSFMRQLLSEEGTLPASDYLSLFDDGGLLTWFYGLCPDQVSPLIEPFEAELAEGTISALDLEFLADLLKHQILDKGRLETEGPLPLARYLWGKEMEIKNLRLILMGRLNGLPTALLEERMRPVYGQ